jgi:hypothetical protein
MASMGMVGQVLQSKDEMLAFAFQYANGALYRENAFRLLQLPVNASDRDITRRKQVFEISINTQAPVPDGASKLFPVDMRQNGQDINHLVDTLRDPLQRFHQEFFWFWPLPGVKTAADPALQALSAGDRDRAQAAWESNSSDPSAAAVSLHNLAVLHHFAALENAPKDKGADLALTLAEWRNAFNRWKQLLALDVFWNLLDNRIREIGDPRLTMEHAGNLRLAGTYILALSNARQAVTYADGEDFTSAKTILEPCQKYLSDAAEYINILRVSTAPFKDRLETTAAAAEEKARNDPAHADRPAESLIQQGGHALKVICNILPENTLEYTTSQDGLLEKSLQCVEFYFQKTDDWHKSLALVEKVKSLSVRFDRDEKIKKRIDDLKEFGKNSNYWCCQGYFDDLPPALFEILQGAKEYSDKLYLDAAVDKLNAALKDFPTHARTAIHPPLAYTLNRRAVEKMNKSTGLFSTPRQIRQRIEQNIVRQAQVILNTLTAIRSNQVEYYGRLGWLNCMACTRTISGRFYQGHFDDLHFIICEACNVKDELELSSIKNSIRPDFNQAKDDLQKANQLQPENQTVIGNLKILRDIFKNFYSITLPEPVSVSAAPAKAPASKPAPAVRQPAPTRQQPAPTAKPRPVTQKTKTKSKAGVWLVLAGLAVMVFAVLQTQSAQRPPASVNTAVQNVISTQVPAISTFTDAPVPTQLPTQPPPTANEPTLGLQRLPGGMPAYTAATLIATSNNTNANFQDLADMGARIYAIPSPYEWEYYHLPDGTSSTDIRAFFLDPGIKDGYNIGMDNLDVSGEYVLSLYQTNSKITIYYWPKTDSASAAVILFYSKY